jgi:DNA-binding IclR family transcriptional regulator
MPRQDNSLAARKPASPGQPSKSTKIRKSTVIPVGKVEVNYGVASVERAIAILSAFRTHGRSLTLKQLTHATKLHASTVLRLLASLERHNFVVRMEHGMFQLGSQLLTLGTIYQRSFRLEEHVVPSLHRLSRQTQESATLFVQDQGEMLVLLRVNSPQPVREDFSAGDRLPLSAGAAGQVLEAFANGVKYTPPEAFAKLPIVMLGGIHPDIGAIAAPVFDASEALIGAITVSGPKARFTPSEIERFCQLLMTEIAVLQNSLGPPASPDIAINVET